MGKKEKQKGDEEEGRGWGVGRYDGEMNLPCNLQLIWGFFFLSKNLVKAV